MGDDLKPMLSKLLATEGQKRYFFAYGVGKRKDGNGDGELSIRTKKPKKPDIEKELAASKDFFEGVCWTGDKPETKKTVYFQGRGKNVSQALVAKMALTAKFVLGKRYDFQLPSPEQEALANQIPHETDGSASSSPDLEEAEPVEQQDAQQSAQPATVTPPRQPVSELEGRLKSLLMKLKPTMDRNEAVKKEFLPRFQAVRGLITQGDQGASMMLAQLEQDVNGAINAAGEAPSSEALAARVRERLNAISQNLKLAMGGNSGDRSRIQALAASIHGLYKEKDFAQALKVLDELEPLLRTPKAYAKPSPQMSPEQVAKFKAAYVRVTKVFEEDPAIRGKVREIFQQIQELAKKNNPLALGKIDALELLVAKIKSTSGPNKSAVFAEYEQAREDLSGKLARVMTFLPEKPPLEIRAIFNGFDKAARLADPENDNKTQSAIAALKKLDADLKNQAAQLKGMQTQSLRQRIAKMLNGTDGQLLDKPTLTAFQDHFRTLDVDQAPDPKAHADELYALHFAVASAIDKRQQALVKFMVDLHRLDADLKRAEDFAQREGLEDVKKTLREQTAIVRSGKLFGSVLPLPNRRKRLRELGQYCRQVVSSHGKQFLDIQKQSIPVPADDLTRGDQIGQGQYGKVYRLDAPPGTTMQNGAPPPSLVGKGFDPNDATQAALFSKEATVYAIVGDHPNIAKCHGIQQIQGESMLVMQEIKGGDVNKKTDQLEQKFRDKKITRAEFLGGIQYLLKGTLQGLAQFQRCGIVHNDIKGDNIRFDEETQQPVLIDMGFAQREAQTSPGGFMPNHPPESHVDGLKTTVSSCWDSFAVGKMLFPLLEQMPDSPQKMQFVAGMRNAQPAAFTQGSHVPFSHFGKGQEKEFTESFAKPAKEALQRDEHGNWVTPEDGEGNLKGQTLKPAAENAPVKPGEYAALTEYVLFMNALTHPDPTQRLKPSQALKHRFLTQGFSDEIDPAKLFGSESAASQPQAAAAATQAPPQAQPQAPVGRQPQPIGAGNGGIPPAPPLPGAPVGRGPTSLRDVDFDDEERSQVSASRDADLADLGEELEQPPEQDDEIRSAAAAPVDQGPNALRDGDVDEGEPPPQDLDDELSSLAEELAGGGFDPAPNVDFGDEGEQPQDADNDLRAPAAAPVDGGFNALRDLDFDDEGDPDSEPTDWSTAASRDLDFGD